jgi:hypothetical protein
VHDLVQLLFVFLVLDIFEQRADICPELLKVFLRDPAGGQQVNPVIRDK